MTPIIVTLTPQTDRDGISVSQTPSAGGAQELTITGALASGGVATLNHGHRIDIYGGSNESGRTFTVTGTDFRGNTITEAITGPNATTASGSSYFKTVTSVSVDADTAGAVEVGVSGLSSSDWYILDQYKSPFNVSIAVVVSDTATYTMQHTFDDLQVSTDLNTSITTFNNDDVDLVAATTNQNGNYAFPISASRIITTAYTSGTVTLYLSQAGGGL